MWFLLLLSILLRTFLSSAAIVNYHHHENDVLPVDLQPDDKHIDFNYDHENVRRPVEISNNDYDKDETKNKAENFVPKIAENNTEIEPQKSAVPKKPILLLFRKVFKAENAEQNDQDEIKDDHEGFQNVINFRKDNQEPSDSIETNVEDRQFLDVNSVEDYDRESYIALLKERDLLKRLDTLERYRFLLFGTKHKGRKRINNRIVALQLSEMKAKLLKFLNLRTANRVRTVFNEDALPTEDFFKEVNYLLKMVKLIDKVKDLEGQGNQEFNSNNRHNSNTEGKETLDFKTKRQPCLIVEEQQLIKFGKNDAKLVNNIDKPCVLVEKSQLYPDSLNPGKVDDKKPCVIVVPKLKKVSDDENVMKIDDEANKDDGQPMKIVKIDENPKLVDLPDTNDEIINKDVSDFDAVSNNQNKTGEVKKDAVHESNEHNPVFYANEDTIPYWETRIWAMYKHDKIFGYHTSSEYHRPMDIFGYFNNYPMHKRGMSILTRLKLISSLINSRDDYKPLRRLIPPKEAMYFFKESNMVSTETRARPIGTPLRWG